MDDNVFYAAFFLPSAAAVLIFGMKYLSSILSSVLQTRESIALNDAYRQLAAQAAASQAETAAALTNFAAGLVKIQSQLAAVEKILKDVD